MFEDDDEEGERIDPSKMPPLRGSGTPFIRQLQRFRCYAAL
jgi:hypothetical protein